MDMISVTFHKLENNGFLPLDTQSMCPEWLGSDYKGALEATLQFGNYSGKKCGNRSWEIGFSLFLWSHEASGPG